MVDGTDSSVDAEFQRALGLHQAEHLLEARRGYERVLSREPRHVQALLALGALALDSGEPAASFGPLNKAVEIDASNAAALLLIGHAHHRLGRFHEALAAYDAALSADEKLSAAHFSRANVLCDLARIDEAIGGYARAIAHCPTQPEFHSAQGMALARLGRHEEALRSYDESLRLGRTAVAWHARGLALMELRRPESALESFDAALAAQPRSPEAHLNRGNCLVALRRDAEALASYDRALALRGDYVDAHMNRANVLGGMERFDAALASFDRALELDPRYPDVWSNRGSLLSRMGEPERALASFDHALGLDPQNAGIHVNRGFFLLQQGELLEGWREQEWRWLNHGTPTAKERRDFPEPRWLGDSSIEGKTILVHREQGIGDALQFCRYARLLAGRGARVVLEAHEALMRLLPRVDGVSGMIQRGQRPPPFDCWTPLLSLPLAFGTTLDSIPAATQYLYADRGLVNDWQTRLGPRRGLRVGLTWSGATIHPNDHNRSIPLQRMLEELPPGLEYVSLQKEVSEHDRSALEGAPYVRDFRHLLFDFDDTAALCECMDVVVSVDTSVAHLAAGLGKRTWILLPTPADWRWLLERHDSPWYPTARLYRQRSAGDWTAVLKRVGADLLLASQDS